MPKGCCHGCLFLSSHLYKVVRLGSVQLVKDVAAKGGKESKEEINKKNDSGVSIVLYLGLSWVCAAKDTIIYPNLLKIGPPLKICTHPPLFLMKLLMKGAFLLKACPLFRPPLQYAVMLSKKHQRSSTVQEERLTNEGRHHFLLLHK